MTKRVTIEILDDTDGSRAEQTVPFGLDGVAYEIDLSTTNANELREALAPYVAAVRRTGARRIKVAVGQPTDSTKQESEPSYTDPPNSGNRLYRRHAETSLPADAFPR